MVKVKAEVGGEVAGQRMSGKKKKDEKKILKVISKRNGATDPKLSLKTKNKKKRNRRKKNKISSSGAEAGTPSDNKSAEPSPVAGDSNSKPQEPNTKNKKQKGDRLKTAPTSDVSPGTEKEELTNVTIVEEEPGTTVTENTGSEGNKESDTQGKKKKKRKNKRKASEALEDTEGTTETTEDKEDGSLDKTEGLKGTKRMKVEKEGEGNKEGDELKSKKTKNQKEKKHVLFIGNLPFEITEDEIREHFKVAADSIVRLTLMSRQKNGKGKGYGFIEFADATGYNNALKLNMSQLKDRKINVEFTTPGKNTKKRKSFIKLKTKKLLGQKKGNKGKKKKGSRKH